MYKFLLASILIIINFTSCTESSSYKLEYEGDLGQKTGISIPNLTPETTFRVDISPGEGNFVIDTGAPLNMLDIGHFNLTDGVKYFDSSGFGLFFPNMRWVSEDIFADNLGVSGIIGADLIKNFNWTLNYADQSITLYAKNSPFIPEPDDVQIPFELKGGGVYKSGRDTVKVGATRHLLDINVEDKIFTALLDTGASYVVLTQSAYDSLDNSNRPQYGNTVVITVSGPINAPLTEVEQINFVDGNLDTELSSVKIVVVPDSFLKPLLDETGTNVQMLLGGSFLSKFKLKFEESNKIILVSPEISVNRQKTFNNLGITRLYKPLQSNDQY